MPSIEINNSQLFYQEYGTGTIPVVFIHGLMLSSNMWMPYYVPSLPSHFRSYALDMRGHGQSASIRGCTIGTMAEDVHAFAQKLSLGKFVCAGVSMGGGVGLQLALRHPESLSALIAISPLTGMGPSGAFMFRIFGSLIAGKRWLLRSMIRGLCVRNPPHDALENALDDAMLVSSSALKEFVADKTPISGLDRLETLDIPTLVIVGEKDTAIPVSQQIALGSRIPNARIITYPNEGHMVAAERQEEVMKGILNFLENVIPAPKAAPMNLS